MLKMPSDAVVPSGPHRELVAHLFTLYTLTGGNASARRIADWTREESADDYVSHTTVGNLLGGRSRDSELPGLDRVISIARALSRHALDPELAVVDDVALRSLWWKVKDPDGQLRQEKLRLRDQEPATDIAAHFARACFRRGSRITTGNFRYAQGAVALVAIVPDPNACRRVFDSGFQAQLNRLQEANYLRRDGHQFHAENDWASESFLVHGRITGRGPDSYVAVEATHLGSIGVYFRDDVLDRTLDEMLAYWVDGAWALALASMRTLGLFGNAFGATLQDHRGVPEIASGSVLRNERGVLWDRHASVVSHGIVNLIEATEDPWAAAQVQRDAAYQGFAMLRSGGLASWNPGLAHDRVAYSD